MLDQIYLLKLGDCSVVTTCKGIEFEAVKLSIGSCIGEECVLMKRPCDSDIKVMSEHCVCYFLPRLGLRKAAPSGVLEALRDNYLLKLKSRQIVKSSAGLPGLKLDNIADSVYSLASPIVRRKLFKLTSHRASLSRVVTASSLERRSTIDIAVSRHRHSNSTHKLKAVTMTQFKYAVLSSGLNSPRANM